MKYLLPILLLCTMSLQNCAETPKAETSSTEAEWKPNYDEAQVPEFTLPALLKMESGEQVETTETWESQRRPEILGLFKEHVYGHLPPHNKDTLWWETLKEDDNALNGKAIRKEIQCYFTEDKAGPSMQLMIYQPKGAEGPVPAFLALNFFGNHSIHPDTSITLSDQWMMNREEMGVLDHKATEKSRGARSSRWPIELIIDRGYALAVIYYGDIDPDFDDGFQNGIQPLFYAEGQDKPADNEWGSIGAWSWGLSRGLDVLQEMERINGEQVAVFGHSRLGKTSLWAGALDERFALVISNNSGCGGAALSRRAFGETVERINTNFPHWFNSNFKKYNGKEANLPVDQHQLLALIAPRPLYVASAEDDQWADPRGEFLSALHANPAYHLYDLPGLPGAEMPKVNEPVVGTIGYHIRTGKHNVTDYDWEQYLSFADLHFGAKAIAD
ncbi:MAG: hypothetical protein KTR30_07140 [Saprospiraceae bacterium]|nr:hypothetical protein [Saprospiraceae bacterium]